MIRTALLLAATLSPAVAEDMSPFVGEWCGIETRLWVGPNHVGFNEHLICRPAGDPAQAAPPVFGTEMTCNNLYVDSINTDGTISLTEVPVPYLNTIIFNLTEPDQLYIDLDDGTAPDLYVRCP